MLVAPASVNSEGIDQMATELQKAANRRNALLSTGPRSLAGKARSRMNAVSHGLTAQQTLLPGEDPAKYEGLRRSMFNSLRPDGALENELVERIASLTWRLRRFAKHSKSHCSTGRLIFKRSSTISMMLRSISRMFQSIPKSQIVATTLTPMPIPKSFHHPTIIRMHLVVGRMFEALLSSDLTSRMTRYETGLQRQLRMSLDALLTSCRRCATS